MGTTLRLPGCCREVWEGVPEAEASSGARALSGSAERPGSPRRPGGGSPVAKRPHMGDVLTCSRFRDEFPTWARRAPRLGALRRCPRPWPRQRPANLPRWRPDKVPGLLALGCVSCPRHPRLISSRPETSGTRIRPPATSWSESRSGEEQKGPA